MNVRDRELSSLRRLLVIATAVSIAHDTDNTLRFGDYVDGRTPEFVTQASIPVAFVIFTAAAVASFVMLRRGRRTMAAALLGIYSLGRLIGPLHYTDVSPPEFAVYQNVLILSDFAVGVAVVLTAIRMARAPRAEPLPRTLARGNDGRRFDGAVR